MPEFNKILIAKAFMISEDQNIEYIILVATNAYTMSIDNLYIILVI